MRAAVLQEDRSLKVQTVPLPQLRARSVLVKVLAVQLPPFTVEVISGIQPSEISFDCMVSALKLHHQNVMWLLHSEITGNACRCTPVRRSQAACHPGVICCRPGHAGCRRCPRRVPRAYRVLRPYGASSGLACSICSLTAAVCCRADLGTATQVGHNSNNGRYDYILQSWLALGPDSLKSEALIDAAYTENLP